MDIIVRLITGNRKRQWRIRLNWSFWAGVYLLAVAVVLFLASCMPRVPFISKNRPALVPAVVVAQHDAPGQKRLARAMDYWNCVLGVPAFTKHFGSDVVQVEFVEKLLRVDHFGSSMHEVREWSRVVSRPLSDDVMFHALQVSADVALVSPEALETIYRHELGHILGLPCLAEGETVMSHVMHENMGLRQVSKKEREFLLGKHDLTDPGYGPELCDPPDVEEYPATGVRE